jgi:hypothetical protein
MRPQVKSMSKVTVRYPEMSSDEIRQKIRELADRWDPQESLDSLVATMNEYEAEYGMSTLEFYARFVSGKMGDSAEFMDWAGVFESYNHVLDNYFRVPMEAPLAIAK